MSAISYAIYHASGPGHDAAYLLVKPCVVAQKADYLSNSGHDAEFS